jgi:hypothetical protein
MNVKREHLLPQNPEISTNADSGLLDAACCASSFSELPIGVQKQMREIVQKHGKDAKISYRTIRMPHPEYSDQTVVLYDDVRLASTTADSGLLDAACCASFSSLVQKTSEITNQPQEVIKNCLVSIGVRMNRGQKQAGLLQKRVFNLLSRDNPEILETLKSLPVASYYPRQSGKPDPIHPELLSNI